MDARFYTAYLCVCVVALYARMVTTPSPAKLPLSCATIVVDISNAHARRRYAVL